MGDFAVVGAGVLIGLDEAGVCRKAEVGLAAVGPTSLRAAAAEAWLVGKALDDAAINRGPAEYNSTSPASKCSG